MLSNLVYQDERVVGHFDLRLWVCVSENFELKLLVKKLLNLQVVKPKDLSMDTLQRGLREIIKDKRVLLVLDDVWNEDREKWVEFKNLLEEVACGSKIIVTTRIPLVALITSKTKGYTLQGLPHNMCMSLFVRRGEKLPQALKNWRRYR